MRLKFIFVGRTRSPYLAAGIDDYLKRIQGYLPAETVVTKGFKAKPGQPKRVILEETKQLMALVKPDEVFVYLDPIGREMTSLELAGWLQDHVDRGTRNLAFGLGGPLGLAPPAAERADLRLCLSRLTLTHEMSRLVLLEQIYRALRINAGHPYHK